MSPRLLEFGGVGWGALIVWLLCFSAAAAAQDRGETRFSFSLVEEGSLFAGRRAPLPRGSNFLIAQPAFAYREGQRWRFSASLAGVVSTQGDSHARLRVRETYLGVTLGDFDFAAGKKLVRWGAGYAFTITGVLDPPRVATDPADRLNLNEGREMAMVDWVRGRHAVTAAWASAGLVERHRAGMRETTALRYNTLIAGVDAAVIVARDRGRPTFAGANFTRVIGNAVELHGEFGHRDGNAAVLGAKVTTRSGVTFIGEYYATSMLPGGPRQSLFLHAGKSRLREMPGWKEWDAGASLVLSATDGSRVLVLDVNRRLGHRFSVYGRALLPAGNQRRSEYGNIPYRALVSAGLRFQI